MKLSSRKQLLKESELTLKSIKKSLNEAAVPEKDVNKVYDWMHGAIKMVVREPKMVEKHREFAMYFLNYLKIQKSTPREAKKYATDTDEAVSSFSILIGKLKEQIADLKKLESKLPEIEKIIKAVESDIKKMK